MAERSESYGMLIVMACRACAQKPIPTLVFRFRGHYNLLPEGHAEPLHSGSTAPTKKNKRLYGPHTDMPLGFWPKNFLTVLVRLAPRTLAAASHGNFTKEPVAKTKPAVTVPAPTTMVKAYAIA
jgi:hypothetical protein